MQQTRVFPYTHDSQAAAVVLIDEDEPRPVAVKFSFHDQSHSKEVREAVASGGLVQVK